MMFLWSVQDLSTKLLMEAMYSALSQGFCVPQALRFAMVMMLKHKKPASIFHWSGFLVTGASTRLVNGHEQLLTYSTDDMCELFESCKLCSDQIRSNGVDGKTFLTLTDSDICSELEISENDLQAVRAKLPQLVSCSDREAGITVEQRFAEMEVIFRSSHPEWFAHDVCT